MKPKEEAVKLLNAMQALYDMKQYPEFIIDENDNQKNDELWESNRELFDEIYKKFAKRSALIAVDMILAILDAQLGDPVEYWQQVKKEIQLL